MIAAGVDDWTLSAFGVLDLQRPSLDGAFLPDRNSLDSLSFGAGLSRRLSSGGTVHFDATSRYWRENYLTGFEPPRPASAGQEAFSMGLSATLIHPLLRGYGKRIARAEQEKARLRLTEANLDATVEALDLIQVIITAYWELAYATQVLEIRRAAVTIAEEQLRITRAVARVGTIAPSETLAIEQAIAVKTEAVLLAEIEVSGRSLALRRLAGLEIGPGEIDVKVTETLEIPALDFNLDETLRVAFANSPILAQLELRKQRSEIDVRVAKDAERSQLDLSVKVGPTGRSDRIGGVLPQIASVAHPEVSAGLTYERQLGNRAALGESRKQRAIQGNIGVQLEETRREIAVAVVNAVNLVRSARKRIEVSDTAIALAEQNLEIQKTMFKAGKTTNFEVLRRQEEVELSRVSRARSIVDALNASTLVYTLTGQLLVDNNIEVMPEDDE